MSDLEKKIITTQGVVRNKRTKPNGEGSIYFNKVRQVWTGAFYDIHGKRRVASFKDRDDAVNWIGKQLDNCLKCIYRNLVGIYISQNYSLVTLFIFTRSTKARWASRGR